MAEFDKAAFQAQILARAKKPKESGSGFWGALGLGGAQGASLGFGDEATGAIQALGNKYLPESMGGGGTAGYSEERDAARAENQAAQKAHPYAYGAGEIAGALPSTIATGGAGSKLATVGANAGLGLYNGLGRSDADLLKGEFGEASEDAGLNALLSGGFSAAGEFAGAGIKGAKNWLSGKANLKRVNAAHPDIRDLKLLGGEDEAMRLGQSLKDEGVVGPFSNAQDVAERANPVRQKVAGELDTVYSGLDEASTGPIHVGQLKNELKQKVLPAWQAGNLKGGKAAAETAIDDIGTNLAQDGGISFKDLRTEKTGLGRHAGFNKLGDAERSVAQQDVYGELAGAMESRAQQVSPELADKMKTLNRRYSDLSTTERIATDAALKEMKEKGLEITDIMLVLGGGLPGAAVAGAKHAIKGRTAAMSAKALDALSALTGIGSVGARATGQAAATSARTNSPVTEKKRKKSTIYDDF